MVSIVPINIGYYQYKSINGQIFKTRVEKCNVKNMRVNADKLTIISGNCNVIGETFFVGMGKINIDLDKTEADFTKICVLNMLCRIMGANIKGDFKLMLTAPPMVYEDQASVLPSYLVGEYDVIHNDGVLKHINIVDVEVIPESFLIYLNNNPKQYADKELFIFDFGGLTSSVVRVNQLQFAVNGDYYVSMPKGMYHVDCEIADYFKANYKMRCNYDNIELYRKNGLYIKNSKENLFEIEHEPITDIYCGQIDELLELTAIKGWELNNAEILVAGGGSKYMFSPLKEKYLPQAMLSKDYLFDNLNGLEIICKEVYGNDNSFACR